MNRERHNNRVGEQCCWRPVRYLVDAPMGVPPMIPDPRIERALELVTLWRAQGAHTDTFHATMGVGWKVCADELEALLREPAAPSPCANCGHAAPHNGPAGDVSDGCTVPGCDCGFYVEYREDIETVKGHWFIQGGEAQFGSIREADCADDVVSAILRHVRAYLEREPAAPSETITEQGWALRQKMKPELWLHPYHAEGGPEHAKLCVTRDDAMTKCPSWREAVYLTRSITVTLTPQPQTAEPERAFGQNIRDTIAQFKGEP